MTPSITAIILTKNEENNIVDCVDSLLWCSEVIVIDDFSDDRTLDALSNSYVKVFKRDMNGNYSEQRNFGLEKATSEWVLFVDADERIENALEKEMLQAIQEDNVNGFFIKRVDFLWGKKLRFGETGNQKFLRLAKKTTGKWVGRVHEEWNIKGTIRELKNELLHFPHPSVSDFITEINQYTSLRAIELFEKKKTVSYLEIVIYPSGKFFYNYFIKLGFRDGIQGLIFALIMSFHAFLVRGKLWLLWEKK